MVIMIVVVVVMAVVVSVMSFSKRVCSGPSNSAFILYRLKDYLHLPLGHRRNW